MPASDARRKQRYDQLVERVLKSGVKFAAGSDMCWFYPGKTRGEASTATFVNLHDAGMPSLDVIRAITINSAEMLGWQDRIGSIEPGKIADLNRRCRRSDCRHQRARTRSICDERREVIKNELGQ